VIKDKDMRRKILGIVLIASAVMLSGCATPEIRKTEKKNELTFYSDSGGQQNAVTEKSKSKTPQVPPAPPNQSESQSESNVQPTNNQPNLTNKKMYTTQPRMTIDQNKKYTATLKTDAGDIVVELTAKETPITVNNFVFLAREKFYDGTIFHRVIQDFMIQGGDPEGTGAGGPGYKFADEKFTGEYKRGVLAMANSGPDTNGSQFFIMHKDNSLPPNYVIFGKVVTGMETVDKIASAPVKPSNSGEDSSPVAPARVETIEILEK
jgi:cyclophilin family peptidyl-prolyl cis-trans isomerase